MKIAALETGVLSSGKDESGQLLIPQVEKSVFGSLPSSSFVRIKELMRLPKMKELELKKKNIPKNRAVMVSSLTSIMVAYLAATCLR